MDNFPNGVSSMGIPLLGGGIIPTTFGTVYFVNPETGNDGNSGKSMNKALQTVAAAYSRVTTNKDDVIALSGNSGHALSDALLITKNRVHFVGLGQPSLAGLQGSRITMADSSAINVEAMVKNTGIRNSFTNIKFVNSSAQSNAKYCFVEGGEGTFMADCTIHMNARLNQTATADLLMGGDSCSFLRVTVGNDNLLTSVARNVVAIDAVSGAQSADGMKNCVFRDCDFQVQSSNASALLLKVIDTAAAKFMSRFVNCRFSCIVSTGGGGVELTVAVASVSSLVDATLYFVNPQTNAASFCTTSDHFEISGSPVFSSNAFEAGTPA